MIPWLKKRDIGLLVWETPGYLPQPPGDLSRNALHNFVLEILGVHILDSIPKRSAKYGRSHTPTHTPLTTGLQKPNVRFRLTSMEPVSRAASLMGRRSVEARIKEWGKQEFVKRMREWGKLGGRPKGSTKKTKKGGK